MFLRSFARRSGVLEIADQAAYESFLGSAFEAPVMVGLFTARNSLAAKMFGNEFTTLAEKFPAFRFFKMDVDAHPAAAYDCEVTSDFQVTIMPLGVDGSSGSEYFKENWISVNALNSGGASNVIKQAENFLQNLKNAQPTQQRKVWEFDPALGARKFKTI